LKDHPDVLHVLGNGKQRKSYLYVQDCIDAILTTIEKSKAKTTVLNLGTDEYCQVNDSIGWICEELGVKPEIRYGGGERGWIGDNPFIFLDCSAVRALGWKPRLTIKQGIIRTVRYLRENPELFEKPL
jgi:UDP-glucose 4-epimerase